MFIAKIVIINKNNKDRQKLKKMLLSSDFEETHTF